MTMFRKTTWKNTASDAVSFHQDQALNTTIFLLKTYGPTGFLLKEEGEARNSKVCLGDPHTCTCAVFIREQEPCKHICWVLLRKFRLPREHEYSFQHGLVERQILEVLHGLHQTRAHRTENDPSAGSESQSEPLTSQEPGSVCRKPIQAQDVCPICQEELLEKKQPVSYCRFSCGNNVHISCMKVWANHQKLSHDDVMVKCPLCREDFSSVKSLWEQVKNANTLYTAAEREKPDKHLGVLCHGCRVCPITGKCFKCTVCRYFYLCEACSEKGCHPQHPFASRTRRREQWCLGSEDLWNEPGGASSQPANSVHIAEDPLPEKVLEGLSVVRVRPRSLLLDEGQQCRICLQRFTLGQHVRTLPCRHKFHRDCVDGILRQSNSCPLDGYVVYNPLTWKACERKTTPKLASRLSSACAKQPENSLKDLFIPGVALWDKTSATPSRGALNLELLTRSSVPLNIQENQITHMFQDLGFTTTDAPVKAKTKVLQKKLTLFPVITSSFGRSVRSGTGDKPSHCLQPLKESKRSPASAHGFVPVENREQLGFFVGAWKPGPAHTATAAFPVRQTRPRSKPRSTTNDKELKPHTSELTLTGVLIDIQHQRKSAP